MLSLDCWGQGESNGAHIVGCWGALIRSHFCYFVYTHIVGFWNKKDKVTSPHPWPAQCPAGPESAQNTQGQARAYGHITQRAIIFKEPLWPNG